LAKDSAAQAARISVHFYLTASVAFPSFIKLVHTIRGKPIKGFPKELKTMEAATNTKTSVAVNSSLLVSEH